MTKLLPSDALVILTQQLVGRGVSQSRWASIGGQPHAAIWKPGSPLENPHLLSNELIAHRIAKELGLPVPDTFGLPVPGQPPVFLQLSFTPSGVLLPPVNVADMLAEHPIVAAKILAFDVMVMNVDRHRGNLAFRSGAAGNPLLAVFDHSHAVLGTPKMAPAPARFQRTDWLGCDGKPGNRHCLLDHFQDAGAIDGAIDAIQGLSDRAIHEGVSMARGFGLSSALANRTDAALRKRRDLLRRIVNRNRSEFRNIAAWTLFGSTA